MSGLTLSDFEQPINANVFDEDERCCLEVPRLEEPSLRHDDNIQASRTIGSWNLRRDERFARLVIGGILSPRDSLRCHTGLSAATAQNTDDYRIAVDAVRYESPDVAAAAVTRGSDTHGWVFWEAETTPGLQSLADLRLTFSETSPAREG